VRLVQEQGKRGPFNTPTEGYKRQLRAIINHDTTDERLGYITAPTLAIAGEKDLVTPNSGMLKIAQAIPGSQLYTFPNTGHAPHVEHVAEFNQLLQAHLTAHATTQYSS
jgi:pimeloyl-ACP methyl ester carboxylesterase